MNVVFHFLLESNISSTSNPISNSHPLNPSLLSHSIGNHLNYPAHIFVAKKTAEVPTQSPPPRFFSPLAASLPCELHIVDFKVPRPLRYSFSDHPVEDHKFLLVFRRLGWDSSYCRTARSLCTRLADEPVNLFSLFKDIEVMHVKAASLNLLHEDTEMLGYTELTGDIVQEGHVVIPPMEIQSYRLELRPHQ